jgi:hypothetical protein
MKKPLIALATALSVSGCAATYKPPVSADPDTSRSIHGTQSDLLRAAKRVLVSEGFQITNTDDAAGVISTAPRDMRLTPEVADCGTTMGLDYLKDNRTSSKVGYGVVASNNRISLKANLSANYLPGNDTQSITLSCISRGILENDLLVKITSVVAK